MVSIYALNDYYTVHCIIATSSELDISFTLNEYKTSEADGDMVLSVCKDKQTSLSVEVMITSFTIDDATNFEDMALNFFPDDDPYSPNRASETFKIMN